MLRLALVATLAWRWLAAAPLVACGGESRPADPPPASSDAGKVVELTGIVTATRDANIRTLAVGHGVRGDDVIETAADASVVIELLHNNARWSLDAGIKSRVDASVAWTLPKQDTAAPVEHATSSAGRHADRQAADTQISAARDEEARQAIANSHKTERARAADSTADKAGRLKGVKISRECLANPLARECGDAPPPIQEDPAVMSAVARYRDFAAALCACTDAACAKQVDDAQVKWRAALDDKHPPSSTTGKAIAARSADTVKRYLECRRRLIP